MADNMDGMLSIYDAVNGKSAGELSAMFPTAYQSVQTDVEKEQIYGIFYGRALQINEGAAKSIDSIYKALRRADKEVIEVIQKEQALAVAKENPVWLTLDRNGIPADTLNNYLAIMMNDPHYKDYRYNVLKASPEIHNIDGVKGVVDIHAWEDADEAESQRYIEERYHMFSDIKHKKAMLLLFRAREYNPILDIVEHLPKWDGQERIKNFLSKWMGCEDSAYTQEVSRLIFAGGINRLYDPGCKFDDVPVLIGTKQGEGKSSIIRWLAINDSYYAEVTQFEGNQAVEQLEGAWVCEISEMLALNKTQEQEAVKAFITRQIDKYRKPYARNPSNLPRRCIMIGTTNSERFLKDKTGNRRFYPVKVNMSGYNLYTVEQECRQYILDCWAEAREKFKEGRMPNFADRSLVSEYRQAQENSMEDDWRVGAIEGFLRKKSIGERVCIRMIAREALPMEGDVIKDPTKKEAHEIGLIIDKLPNWKRVNGNIWINAEYGSQKGWVKTEMEEESVNIDIPVDEEIPF